MRSVRSEQPTDVPEGAARQGALVLKALPILLVPPIVALLYRIVLRLLIGPLPVSEPIRFISPPIVILVIAIFATSMIVLVRVGRPTVSALGLIGAWTLITTLTALRTGVSTFVPALLIILICTGGLLIDWVASVSLAAIATLLVATIAWLDQRGLVPPRTRPPAFLANNLSILAVGFWIALFWMVAALTALLAGDLKRALHAGGATLEPAVAARVLERMSDADRGDELSVRELDVLRLLVAGASNKAIAARLSLSENTIKSHISHIFVKLGVQSRTEAVAAALHRGVISLDRS